MQPWLRPPAMRSTPGSCRFSRSNYLKIKEIRGKSKSDEPSECPEAAVVLETVWRVHTAEPG